MEWHLSRYVTAVEEDVSILLYHALTGSLLRITETDKLIGLRALLAQRSFFMADGEAGGELTARLRELMYIFPANINETELAKQMFIDRASQRETLQLMIYVTNACNFRCIYCPQPHSEECMSLSTIHEICSAVERYVNENAVKRVVVSWFGGEPLLNLPVIERGMTKLGEFCRAQGINLTAGMTTNGYGLTADVFERLMRLGVGSFQITLDGMPEAHNQNRTTRSGGETWQTIWKNLLAMNASQHTFLVMLRSNVNPGNLSSVKQLIELKRERLDQRFVLQVQPIINMGGLGSAEAAYCSEIEATNVQIELYGVLGDLRESGFGRISSLLRPFGLMCSCASRNYLVIKTDGSLCKCELLVDDALNQLGRVENGRLSVDDARLAQYIAPSFSDLCMACPLFPLCYGLNCPHKKAAGQGCTLRQSFDLERHIRLLAAGLSAAR